MVYTVGLYVGLIWDNTATCLGVKLTIVSLIWQPFANLIYLQDFGQVMLAHKLVPHLINRTIIPAQLPIEAGLSLVVL